MRKSKEEGGKANEEVGLNNLRVHKMSSLPVLGSTPVGGSIVRVCLFAISN